MTDYIRKLLEFETWVDSKDYEGIYKISSWGKFKSLKRYGVRNDRLLKPSLGGDYYRVSLYKNGVKDTVGVHVLLAEAFKGFDRHNTKNLVVHHIDGNSLNNDLDNLEIRTSSGNNMERYILSGTKTAIHSGVHLDKRAKKFRAQIDINKIQTHLGIFKDQDKAFEVFKEAEIIKYNAPEEEVMGRLKTLIKKSREYKFSSDYKGVSWCKSKKKWKAYLYIDNKYKYLGLFDKAIDAHHVVQKALKEIENDFIRKN